MDIFSFLNQGIEEKQTADTETNSKSIINFCCGKSDNSTNLFTEERIPNIEGNENEIFDEIQRDLN